MNRFASALLVLWLVTSSYAADPPQVLELPDAETMELLMDLTRFPSPRVTETYCAFAGAHYYHVRDSGHHYDHLAWYPDYLAECERRANCWCYLRMAQDDTNYIASRYMFLDQLRSVLGDDAFLAGRMPAPAPCLDDIWR